MLDQPTRGGGGDGVAVLNTSDYTSHIFRQFSNQAFYQKVPDDPTFRFADMVRTAHKDVLEIQLAFWRVGVL